MALSWSKRRKLLYSAVMGALLLAVFYFVYTALFTQAPTCFDGALNGDEHGVDCGGSCQLLCRSETRSPVVLWSRAFEVAGGQYTAAAYVQNPNPGAMARNVAYTFQLFDEKNLLIVEREGTLDIPPVQTVPFIDPNINVGSRVPARAIFAFAHEPVWQRGAPLPPLTIGNQYLAPDGSRLSATISNSSVYATSKVTATAVLFDSQGVARAASRSSIASIPRKGSQDVVFTWPSAVAGIVRAEITVLPSF